MSPKLTANRTSRSTFWATVLNDPSHPPASRLVDSSVKLNNASESISSDECHSSSPPPLPLPPPPPPSLSPTCPIPIPQLPSTTFTTAASTIHTTDPVTAATISANTLKPRRPLSKRSERRFKCTRCDSRFERLGHMQSHVDTVHDRKRDHRCHYPKCDKVFGHRSSLSRHIKQHHSSTRKAGRTAALPSHPASVMRLPLMPMRPRPIFHHP